MVIHSDLINNGGGGTNAKGDRLFYSLEGGVRKIGSFTVKYRPETVLIHELGHAYHGQVQSGAIRSSLRDIDMSDDGHKQGLQIE